MPVSVINPQLTQTQKEVLNSILEDISYLENTLQVVENKNLISFTRISITFNYISLETLRDFYCERLSIKKEQKLKNYNWKSFFIYPGHREKMDLILQKKQYLDFKKAKDMEKFIDKLRIQRNLILHRSSLLNKKQNRELQTYLQNIKYQNIEKIFIKSKNCIEIMNYIMEFQQNY